MARKKNGMTPVGDFKIVCALIDRLGLPAVLNMVSMRASAQWVGSDFTDRIADDVALVTAGISRACLAKNYPAEDLEKIRKQFFTMVAHIKE
jgi:hypothetical protein